MLNTSAEVEFTTWTLMRKQGHLEGVHAFGLSRLVDLAGHENVEQEGVNVKAAIYHSEQSCNTF